MNITTNHGVLIIREGVSRLRWAHEIEGAPPPTNGHEWLVAGLWPDDASRRVVYRRLDQGDPVLVVLSHEPPRADFPAEHVLRVPHGVKAECDSAVGLVTLEVPVLDWLRAADRRRGLTFALSVRAILQSTPRFQLPPLVLDNGPGVRPLRFACTTGIHPLTSSLLRDTIHDMFGQGASATAGGLCEAAL